MAGRQRLSEKDGSCCEIWTLRINEQGKPEDYKEFVLGASPQFSSNGREVANVFEKINSRRMPLCPRSE